MTVTDLAVTETLIHKGVSYDVAGNPHIVSDQIAAYLKWAYPTVVTATIPARTQHVQMVQTRIRHGSKRQSGSKHTLDNLTALAWIESGVAVAAAAGFTTKPDYSYSTTDFPSDPSNEITVIWRNMTDTGAGPSGDNPPPKVGTDGQWKITASNISGITVNDLYTSLTALWNDCATGTGNGAWIIKIPAGKYEDVFSPTGVGYGIIWAPPDGSNMPQTILGGASVSGTLATADTGTNFEFRNITFGYTDAQYDYVSTSGSSATSDVEGYTLANPVVVTQTAHGRSNGEKIFITGFDGTNGDINANGVYTVAGTTSNSYELSGKNGTGWDPWISGGLVSTQQDFVTNDGKIAVAQYLIKNSVAATTIIRNGTMRGSHDDGASSGVTDEMTAWANGLVSAGRIKDKDCWFYDVEAYDCGSNDKEHLIIYGHSGRECRIVRCKLSNSTGGHMVKLESFQTLVLLDNTFISEDDTVADKSQYLWTDNSQSDGNAAVIDFSVGTKIIAYRNRFVMKPNVSAHKSIFSQHPRENVRGGVTDIIPNPFDYAGEVARGDLREPVFDIGNGGDTQYSAHTVALVNTAMVATNTLLALKKIGTQGHPSQGSGPNDISNTGANFYRVLLELDDGTIHSSLGTSDGVADIVLASAIPTAKAASVSNKVVVYAESGGAVDTLNLNEPFWNSGHGSYYWLGIDDGTGFADLSKANIQKSVIDGIQVVWQAGATGPMDIIRTSGGYYSLYYTSSAEILALPGPPANDPAGAWSVTGGGDVRLLTDGDDFLHGNHPSHASPLGRDGVTDFIWPAPILFANVGYEPSAALRTVARVNHSSVAGLAADQSAYNFSTDVRYLTGAGALVSLTTEDGDNDPALNYADAAASSQAAADQRDIDLDDATGFAVGKLAQIPVASAWSGIERYFESVIAGVSGNIITLSDDLPGIVPSGGTLTALDAAGARPATWTSEDAVHSSEEYA